MLEPNCFQLRYVDWNTLQSKKIPSCDIENYSLKATQLIQN